MSFFLGLLAGALVGWIFVQNMARQTQRGIGGEAWSKLPPAPAASAAPVPPAQRDDLTKIHGIGPAFAKRLNEAGIHSYAALAALTPDQVRQMVNVAGWQKIEPETWIAEARQLAQN